MARPVAVVFDPDFSARLEELAFRMPVWICETEPNRAAAEQAWQAAQQWPQIEVTIFRDGAPATLEEWRDFLGMIELHHGAISRARPYDTLEVIGSNASNLTRAAFADAGFAPVELTANGFRAVKKRG